jgi:transposase InsO family protein
LVPRSLRVAILEGLHEAGHLGVHRTISRVREAYYWRGYQQDVREWCRKCEKCQKHKRASKTPQSSLKPSVVGRRFQRIAIDILGPLPVSERGNKYILVISDYFSKWCAAAAMANMEAETVAEVLLKDWVSMFGVPETIHSDQGTQFESNLFQELCRLLGIEKTRCSPYYPRSNGLVERFNATLEAMLAKMVQDQQRDWDAHLPWVMMAYRSSVHETTQTTPCMMMFGEEAVLPTHLLSHVTPGPEIGQPFVFQLKRKLDTVHELARSCGQRSQERQERQYNRGRHQLQYAVGDQVWLQENRRYKGLSPKLSAKWVGPYSVLQVMSDWLVRIKKGSRSQVVHHNRIKPHTGNNPQPDEAREVAGTQPEPEEETTATARTTSGREVKRPPHLADFFQF